MPTLKEPIAPAKKRTVEREIKERLHSCPYSFIFCKVSFEFRDGHLIVRGSVPSFYLKQKLQELLKNIEHVNQIQNEVKVVSSTGLSSSCHHRPR